jgi:NAD(P)-dependent dehydrogenase (short-subunit alcohol dehydrogenase family)
VRERPSGHTVADRARLDGTVVVVAGAGGGGIGTAICVAAAAAGATVVGLDNTGQGRDVATAALASGPGTGHRVVDVDVRSPEAVDEMLATVEADLGPVRGLVNVVGGLRAAQWQRLADLDDDVLDQVLGLNLRAPFVTSRALARRRLEDRAGCSIVHLTSVSGIVGMPFGAAYAAAKAALANLTRTMAVEWGPAGIRVNAVAPGSIRTAKLGRERVDGETGASVTARGPGAGGDREAGPAADGQPGHGDHVVPLRRRGEPDDIAGPVLFLLSDLAAYVSGHVLVVDGGMTARPPFDDETELPVFVRDSALRARLTSHRD